MPTPTRTFRVFVSSTFEDLKEERNVLQDRVFPNLAEFCDAMGARFQAIDLRWGVRDEAAVNQKTMEICLSEIARCQRTGIKPNFIILLGERYGWCPLPAHIEASEFEAVSAQIAPRDRALIESWYERDDNSVPPEYLLKPRTNEWVDANRWTELERQMHAALCQGALEAGLPPERRIRYEASATHQEILMGLGSTPEDANTGVKSFVDNLRAAVVVAVVMARPLRIQYPGAVYHVMNRDTVKQATSFVRVAGVVETSAEQTHHRDVTQPR